MPNTHNYPTRNFLAKEVMSAVVEPSSSSSSSTTTTEDKPKSRVPTWVPISAFLGTSIALAIPLLLLRRQRGSVARLSIKGSTPPPPRRASGSSATIPMSSSSPATTSTVGFHETIKESLSEEKTSLASALSQMNASSAMMAAKAFGIATGLVAVSGFGVIWAAKTTLGVQDTREFGHRMRTLLRLMAPGLTSRIRRAPETDDERRESLSVAPFGAHEDWNWLEAEKRLQKAYEAGGFPVWAQAALREMEAEARLERSKREEESAKNQSLEGSIS